MGCSRLSLSAGASAVVSGEVDGESAAARACAMERVRLERPEGSHVDRALTRGQVVHFVAWWFRCSYRGGWWSYACRCGAGFLCEFSVYSSVCACCSVLE